MNWLFYNSLKNLLQEVANILPTYRKNDFYMGKGFRLKAEKLQTSLTKIYIKTHSSFK